VASASLANMFAQRSGIEEKPKSKQQGVVASASLANMFAQRAVGDFLICNSDYQS